MPRFGLLRGCTTEDRVWQLTSDVTCTSPAGRRTGGRRPGALPSGSVTRAPKQRTMGLLRGWSAGIYAASRCDPHLERRLSEFGVAITAVAVDRIPAPGLRPGRTLSSDPGTRHARLLAEQRSSANPAGVGHSGRWLAAPGADLRNAVPSGPGRPTRRPARPPTAAGGPPTTSADGEAGRRSPPDAAGTGAWYRRAARGAPTVRCRAWRQGLQAVDAKPAVAASVPLAAMLRSGDLAVAA